MDHHCYFTNNCIGYKTIKAYWLFLFYTMLLSAFGISTIARKYLQQNADQKSLYETV
jgi:hypothetical protein